MIFSWCKKFFKTKKYSNLKLFQRRTNIKDICSPKTKINKKSLETKEKFITLFGPKPPTTYNCQYNCRFSSNDQNLLKKHIKKYHCLTNNKFICPYCNVSFTKVKRLEIHKVIYCTKTSISLSL